MSVSSPLLEIAQALQDAGIPFRVIGAAALAAHGVSRATQYLDLLVTDTRVLREDTWRSVDLHGFEVERRRGTPDDPLTGVVRIDEEIDDERDWDVPLISVDIVVIDQPWALGMVERTGPTLSVDGLSIESVSLADLVLLKLYAGGTKDQADVNELLATHDGVRWRRDVDARVAHLPERCPELWRALASAD